MVGYVAFVMVRTSCLVSSLHTGAALSGSGTIEGLGFDFCIGDPLLSDAPSETWK
jgi:hypothetical protein